MTPAEQERPRVCLPGTGTEISAAAKQLGQLLAKTGRYFRRGANIVRLDEADDAAPLLRTVTTASLPSMFEDVARLVSNSGSSDSSVCSKRTAELIHASEAFLREFRRLKIVSPCPVLVDRGDALETVIGYDEVSGVLAFGDQLPDVSLEEAVATLKRLVTDFKFATASDRSRALAALITPALLHGGLLGARAPMDLGEANQSQAGKGFRNKLTAATYRQTVRTVTQKKGGVGSLEESFNSVLIQGATFISLDNIRGKIDSPALESFLTEELYNARAPYQQPVEIDPRPITLMMTSNRADITPDLSNRSSCVRILKQDPDYRFHNHDGRDILDWTHDNQPHVLASVFAVVREWFRRGKPRSCETRHDFRRWAQTLDFIVREILDEAPLLDGHTDATMRMTTPHLNWLRDVAIEVSRKGLDGEWLRAHQLLNVIHDADVEIPGLPEDGDLDDDAIRDKALLAIGRRLSKCFREDTVEIDSYFVSRREVPDENYRKRWEYCVRVGVEADDRCDGPPSGPHAPTMAPGMEGSGPRIPRGRSKYSDVASTPDVFPFTDEWGACGDAGVDSRVCSDEVWADVVDEGMSDDHS